MASALFTWRRLPGVERPAVTGLIPSLDDGWCVVADVGANVDCKPSQMEQFAVLASAWLRMSGHRAVGLAVQTRVVLATSLALAAAGSPWPQNAVSGLVQITSLPASKACTTCAACSLSGV